jgi:hypothetical protein
MGYGVVSLKLFSQSGEISFFVRNTVHRMMIHNRNVRQYEFLVENG